jgi:hypothetical protein
MMHIIDRYEAVNKCETLEELAQVIESFADEHGEIQGRSRSFTASKMATICRNYSPIVHNGLTRELGVRQQALYILFYEGKLVPNEDLILNPYDIGHKSKSKDNE